MTANQNVIQSYLDLWNEPDDTRRAALASQVFTPDATYVDPLVVARGRDTIVATVGAVQQQFPGWSFRLLDDVDAHHDVARFRWTLSPDGTTDPTLAPVVGFDVAVLTDKGAVCAVHGFLDKVPTG